MNQDQQSTLLKSSILKIVQMPLALLHFLTTLAKTSQANIAKRINEFKDINSLLKTKQICLHCQDNLLKIDSSLERYSPKQIKNQCY